MLDPGKTERRLTEQDADRRRERLNASEVRPESTWMNLRKLHWSWTRSVR